MIRASGDDNGYIATAKEYQDYHLIVEYKWGKSRATAPRTRWQIQ